MNYHGNSQVPNIDLIVQDIVFQSVLVSKVDLLFVILVNELFLVLLEVFVSSDRVGHQSQDNSNRYQLASKGSVLELFLKVEEGSHLDGYNGKVEGLVEDVEKEQVA